MSCLFALGYCQCNCLAWDTPVVGCFLQCVCLQEVGWYVAGPYQANLQQLAIATYLGTLLSLVSAASKLFRAEQSLKVRELACRQSMSRLEAGTTQIAQEVWQGLLQL